MMEEIVLDSRRKKELTSKLWTLSYPSIIAYSLQAFYDLIDMMWVGKISKEAIGGVTLFSTIYGLFTVLNEIAGSSSVSMISQSYGRKTEERTQRISEQTISFKIVLALMTAILLLIFINPLLNLYSDDAVVKQAALDYGMIRIFALPIAFSSYSINTIFRCTGDSKTPMKIMVVASIGNLIFDPIFMFPSIRIGSLTIPGLNLGVFGAGLATVIFNALSFTIGFIILLRGRKDISISFKGLLRLDKEIDLQLLSIGLPAGLQLLVRQGFNALLMLFITTYGTLALTVMGLGAKLMMFGFTPIIGFIFAGSTLVGHALGRDNIEEACFLTRVSTFIISGLISIFAAMLILFPKSFLGIFTPDTEVLAAGTPMLRWISAAIIITSIGSGMRIAFSGSGYNRPILVSTLVSRWAVQLPLMYVLVNIMQVDMDSIWISFLIAEIADLSVIIYYYRRGDWKLKRV